MKIDNDKQAWSQPKLEKLDVQNTLGGLNTSQDEFFDVFIRGVFSEADSGAS